MFVCFPYFLRVDRVSLREPAGTKRVEPRREKAPYFLLQKAEASRLVRLSEACRPERLRESRHH